MFLDRLSAKILSLVLFSLLVSCGGSSGSNDDSSITTSVNSLDDIVGFWDATIEVDGLTDEIFFLITDSGLVSVFDYLGDSFDDSDDCYLIAEEILVFTHLNENEFLSESIFDNSIISFNAFNDGSDLILTDSSGDETRLSPTSLNLESIRSMDCLAVTSKPGFESQKQSSESTKSKTTVIGRF